MVTLEPPRLDIKGQIENAGSRSTSAFCDVPPGSGASGIGQPQTALASRSRSRLHGGRRRRPPVNRLDRYAVRPRRRSAVDLRRPHIRPPITATGVRRAETAAWRGATADVERRRKSHAGMSWTVTGPAATRRVLCDGRRSGHLSAPDETEAPGAIPACVDAPASS
jgi:hypothetical protein